jgi:GNAT superfamily N-acetyltransferase
MTSVSRDQAYEFSLDTSRLDREWIHRSLSTLTFWAKGRPRADQDRILETSRNYGMYDPTTGAQVAYARVVTDEVTFAWLADVIVDPAHRKRGIGRALIAGILEDLAPWSLRRIVLKASEEGRGLYEQAGWAEIEGAEDWLELRPR